MSEIIMSEMVHESHTDEDAMLVRAAQQNPLKFKTIYQKWMARIYRYFYFRVGNVKDAEDLTSQVFLKVFESLPRYQNRGCFSAWLFSIAHARVVDFYRSKKKEGSLELHDAELSVPDMQDDFATADEVREVLHLFHTLNEEEQELIRLRFIAELSYQEIGAILSRKEDTVRKSVSRLLSRMQSTLEVQHE
jgi:RNA polymerase sigma-70 factor, ECF subfamily